MPLYFFNIREAGELSRDREGQELPDAEAARQEAINASREILGEKLLHGGTIDPRSIEITDEAGTIIDVVNAHDVLYKDGKFRTFPDDVTHSAPVNTPRS